MRFTLTEREVFDIQVDTLRRALPWTLELDMDCYVPALPEQTIRMSVRRTVGLAFLDVWGTGEVVHFDLNISGTRFSFKAIVTDVFYDSRMAQFDCKLRPQGRVMVIGRETHPNCRSVFVPTKEKNMATLKTGIPVPEGTDLTSRKFYVGSKQIFPGGNNSSWAKGTLKDAINQAHKMADETGEDQFVVRITRVVRRRPTPVDIEKV